MVLIILLLPFTLDYRFVFVDGDSMHPTYTDWELVVEERVSSLGEYWRPKRGDVIVVVDDVGDKLIKRVIGLPGEKVTINNKLVDRSAAILLLVLGIGILLNQVMS